MELANVEQTLFLHARRTSVRAPREIFLPGLRRLIAGAVAQTLAICSAFVEQSRSDASHESAGAMG
jgi:hypothetical protein